MTGRQTIADALRDAARTLEATSGTPRLDAELLMGHALGVSRSELLLRHMRDHVPDGFAPLLERRQAHEPIAYITGSQEFYGLPFAVCPDVLIPRADSEVLVETALEARPDATRVLDCGTGTGALLLAVLYHLPQAHGTGMDRSAGAIAVARGNAEALGISDRVSLRDADWTAPGWSEPLGGPFDLILANPPYVETGADIAPTVRDFEPEGALFAGPEGLDAYRVLIPQLPGLLAPDGAALVEIGAAQAEAVSALADRAGLAATLFRDLAGRPRALLITHKG